MWPDELNLKWSAGIVAFRCHIMCWTKEQQDPTATYCNITSSRGLGRTGCSRNPKVFEIIQDTHAYVRVILFRTYEHAFFHASFKLQFKKPALVSWLETCFKFDPLKTTLKFNHKNNMSKNTTPQHKFDPSACCPKGEGLWSNSVASILVQWNLPE